LENDHTSFAVILLSKLYKMTRETWVIAILKNRQMIQKINTISVAGKAWTSSKVIIIIIIIIIIIMVNIIILSSVLSYCWTGENNTSSICLS
jgi:hypothetical protein